MTLSPSTISDLQTHHTYTGQPAALLPYCLPSHQSWPHTVHNSGLFLFIMKGLPPLVLLQFASTSSFHFTDLFSTSCLCCSLVSPGIAWSVVSIILQVESKMMSGWTEGCPCKCIIVLLKDLQTNGSTGFSKESMKCIFVRSAIDWLCICKVADWYEGFFILNVAHKCVNWSLSHSKHLCNHYTQLIQLFFSVQ